MPSPNPAPRRRRAAFAAVLLAGSALGGLAWNTLPAFAEGNATQNAPVNVPAAGAGPIAVAAAALPSFADLAAKVRPAVVTITSTERVSAQADSPFQQGSGPDDMFRRYFGAPGGQGSGQGGGQGGPGAEEGRGARPRTVQGLGSGFIVDAEGHVVTNNHVVNGATRVTVTLADGRELPARLVGRDPRTDLAVLKIDAGGPLPYLALGDSDKARVGDWVVAMGNPFGLGGTLTAGIVSARSRDIGSGPYDDYLQVDAPINRGNSGGPLFALDGTVIGVNTAILSPSGGSVGIGFAIPSNLVRNVVAQLEEHGRIDRGWLGVVTQPVDANMASALRLPNNHGALIADAQRNSPAANAGVQSGDVITAVNGKPVASPRELARTVAGLAPGSTATLTLLRDGNERTLSVTLARQQDETVKEAAADRQGAERGIGVALAPLNPQVGEELGLPPGTRGAVIAQVRPDSPAEAAGLRRGDVILGVGNRAVGEPGEAAQAIREALRGNRNAVALRVLREGQSIFVAVPAEANAASRNG
ncbi:DegQ family serine endoprotease [Roseomonas sp. NAR14]|uniref:Probable periplasmic serine endoprotease DegP-like n=1 Tax=Roseomonas acroporae TaxID=2937791 RepID=A0A9X1YBL4_9PROT|nr:DegQ family serine endoprotease [Roseomonas acroporae]MCK8786730.1 DegQ family serine endoprotease [Roseomonas acroporae]